jgi:class 3 adenylate cyclase
VAAPTTRYARSGEVHLAYQVIGDGPRDVVLSLDWASHLEVLWEQPFVQVLLSSLARYSRVLWFDMRGVGLSDALVSPAAPEDWMDDVAAVMDAAGSEHASVIAHGHAVQMALMSAATHPDRTDSLVLVNGFARFSRADDYPAGVPAEAANAVLDQVGETWGDGRMSALLGPSVADAPGMTEWYGRLERFAASPGTALARMQAILELDVREVLPLVTAPTLVIQNLGDLYVRSGHGRYLADRLPDATLLERDSADHWPVPDPDLLAAIEEFITGTRVEEAEVDRVLTTVLFVDVVGSTEHVSELGDRRWQMLLDQFVDVVQRELRTHRGVLSERAGDGVLATFDGPARAIRCAWGIRDSLRRSGLEVRCGLHTGEVTQRNRDVAGLAVHIGARVSAVAAPGEVLVTRTVRDLVAGSGIEFDDRGQFALKGVNDPWELYATSS